MKFSTPWSVSPQSTLREATLNMKFSVLIIFSFLLFSTTNALAQEKNAEFQTLEELDSLTILDLIDSLMSMTAPKSEISVRVGYLNQVSIAGRDLGIKQKGFNAGANYFHKSGFWGGITGFWFSEFNPTYTLTDVSIGYMGLASKKFSYMATYSHTFYNASELATLENTLGVTGVFDFKYIAPYIDYSFYFGKETAHRITPGITFDISKKNILMFDEISFRPSASVIFGNQNVTNTIYVFSDSEQLQILLSRRAYLNNLPNPTPREQKRIIELTKKIQEFVDKEESSKNVFGLMNYGFSFPLSFRKGNFNFSATYTYNIPVALSGESFDLSPNDYISFSLSYKFKL